MQPSSITLEPQERGLSTWPTSPKKDCLDPPCPSLPNLSVSVDQAEDSDDASSSYNSWSSFSFSSSPTSSDYQCSPDRLEVDAENAGGVVAHKVAESDVCDGRTNSADQEQTSSQSPDGSITFVSDKDANSESYPSMNMAKMKMVDKYSKRTDLFEVSEANKKADPGVQLVSGSTLSCKKSSKTLPKTTTPSSCSKEKYLDLPVEEYDKVESSESKGLKLTFRRKSTERLQPPLAQSKEKKIKPPPSIPKLIVQKCKSPEGYSKKELQCSICQTEVKQKDLDRRTTNIKISIDKKAESAGHIDDVKRCLDTSDKMENACVDNQETTSRVAHRDSVEAPKISSECLQVKSEVPPKLKPKSKQEEKITYVTISSSSSCSLSESSLKSTRPSYKTSTPNNKDGEKLNSKEKCQVNTTSSQKLEKSSSSNSAPLAPKLHIKENDLSSSECHIKDFKPTKSSSDSPKVYKSSKSHSNSPNTHEVTKTSKPLTPASVCQSKQIDSSHLTSLNSEPDLKVSISTPETSLSHDRNGKVDLSSLPSEIHKSKKITKPTPQTEAEKQNRPFSKSSDLYSKPKSSTDSSSILSEIEDKASKPTNSSPIDTEHNKVKNSLTIAHNTSSKIANASNSSPLKHSLQKDKIKSAKALSTLPEVRNTEAIPNHSSQSIPSDAKNDSSIQIQNNQSVNKSAKTSTTFESPTKENTVKTSSSLVSNHSKMSRSRNSLSLTELDEERNKPTNFSSLKEDIQIKAKISKSASLIEQGSQSGANRSLKYEHTNKEIKTSIASSQATSITNKESKPSVSKVHGNKLDSKVSKLNNEIDKKFNDFVKCSFSTHAISKKTDKLADLSSSACDLKLKHKSGHTSSHTKEASKGSSLPSIAHTNKSNKSTKTSTLSSEHHEKSSSSKNPSSAEPKLDKKQSKSVNVDIGTLLHQTPKQKESSSKVNDQPEETKSNESNEKLSIPNSTDGVIEKDLASFDTLKRNVSDETLTASPNSQSEQNCVVQSNKMFIQVPASPNENLDITFQEKYTSQELKSVECLPVLIHEMSHTYRLSKHNNKTRATYDDVDSNPRLLRKPYYKRSDSAPPPSSSSLLSKTSSSVLQDSSDYATPCRTALLDSVIQQERPKSSPPLTYYCFQSFQNSGKKSPVVILDRLPSPVIELYSMQTMNDAPLLDGPIQLDSKGVCNEENLSQEEPYTSDWNSSDCETNRISSGKLKFTYRKVADKKKYHIKTNRKAQPKNPTPDRTVTGEQLELGLKESYTPTRRQYLRASKCGVRYINDDDDVIEEIMAASWLEDQNILEDKKFTSKKGSVNSSRGMNGVRKKRGPKSKTLKMAAPEPAKEKHVDENDGLVDPRIKAMSEALRRADETGRNAEYIAFNTSQRHHSFGPNNKSKTNPVKRNVGGKLRQTYSRRKYCFGRKQHAPAGAYLKQQNSTMRCSKSKCNFNVRNDEDEHVSYRRRDDLNAQTMNPTNTPLCTDLSCHVGELCSSGKYRNRLKSDVYNARAADESSFHFIDPRIHMQVQFCEKARKCSCFRCQNAQTLLDENERYRLCCRDNRNILRDNGLERQSTKCQRCCSHCICRAGYNNLIENNEMYSSFYNQDEKSDDENTENNPAETNLNENNIFITTEPGVTEDSLEEYTLRDYALCLDRHASDEIPRDVDLMGLDYSEFENQEDELDSRTEGSCARNQAEISDNSWNIQSADEISPSFYSFYFQGPEGKRSATHGDKHEEGMDNTKMQCTPSKQKMPPTGITKTSSHPQFLCNPQTAPGSANLVPMPQRSCINKPLSILICPSPDNSDYGSPPSLTEYKSPLWCKEKNNSLDPDAHHTVPCCSGAKCVDSHFEEAARPNDDTQEESSFKGDLQQGKQLSKLTLPRIIVSSPSSTNTQSNETPTSVSPSCVSYASFLSPSMYHARRNQRCDSPFRLPYILDSPSKQTVEGVCKSGCDLGSRKFPEEKIHRQSKLPSPKHRRHYQKRLKRVKRPTHSDHLVDSDDSDSTLVYPTVGKVGLCSKHVPSRRSSLGVSSNGLSEVSPNSALNSPNFKSDERSEHTASSDSQSIERRKSELSNLVSDLRESISKSKALKRSRRTNSFSGDSQPKLSDPDICIQRTTNNRPTFERFMSVEAIMDSDTPYATITRGINNTSKCEEIELMKYVSGVCLQRKGEETASASSVAETQMYGIEFSHLNQNNCTIVNENKKKKTNEMVDDSIEATVRGNNTLSNFPEVPTDDSDCEGKLMVVIENAESNEVIEGDEAYNKVTSGSYRLTMGPGNRFRTNGRRIADRRRGKERGLISIQSLLSRKTANKNRPSRRDGLQAHKTLTESTEDDVPTRQRKECFSSTLQNVVKSRAPVNGAFRKRYSTKRKRCKDSPELTAHCPLKRRRKHPEGSVQTLSKPESPDLLAEQLNQSSAARILQELPRYNWLEQKILQKNYTPVSGVVNLSTGQAQESSRSGSSKSQLSVATSSRPSTKSSPKIAGESQELSLAETQKDVQAGRLATNSKLQEEMDTRGAHLPQIELAEITKCNERDMATLTEMPSSLTSEALAGISEVNTSQLCPPSPDDTNEESGLTIDLGHEDEADSSARDAMSPAAEVDAEITEAHTSSTDSLLERVADEITYPGSCDHGSTVFQTSVKLSPPQLDLSFHTSEEDGRPETSLDRETIKVESSEMSGSLTQLSTNSSSALTTSTTTSASPFSATDMSPGGYSQPALSSTSVATNSAAASVQKQGGMTAPEADEANLPQATTAPSASATGHANSRFGVAIRTNTTTTSTTTTSSSLMVTCAAPAVDNSTLPLDLCLKKTESLATTNSRVKGHPPVQMVLPQIQHKTLTSPHLVPTSPAIPDIKTGKTSVSSVSQELDSKPIDNIGDDILPSKSHQRASLGSEFKVEATYPLHTDTLDLCIKTSNGIKSLSSNPDTSAHLADGSGNGSTIDERITIGLALSAELETEADRAGKAKSLDMEASIRTLVQANVTDVGTSLKPDLLDLPLSLSTSYQDISKTMTDAELDQEFQKHLIEFKALEKLAERKAQEQMQVAIMRKRKAAMLRIMEMKKAKRDFDRVGQLSSLSHDNDRPSVATSKILSNISPNTFVASTTSTVPTLTSTSTSVMKPSLSNLEGHSSPATIRESASKAQTLLDPPLSETSEKITDSETPDVSSQSSDSLATSQIKTEVMDCDSEITSPGLKVECKLEIMEVGCDEPNETNNESHTIELNPSESKSNTESAICLGTAVEGEKAVDTKQSKEHKDTEKTSAKTANVLTPTPAHQSQPQIALLDMQDSPVTTAYILGPYHRRSVQINEPPFIGKDIQKNDQPQRAHNQRPFQTAGNLIFPNSGTFSLSSSGSPNTSSNSKQRHESAHAIKPGINQNSKLDKPLTQPLQKSSSGPPSLNDGSNPQRCTDLITLRNQRKSLDDSDLRNQVRVASKTILDSGPKSADQVNKTYQPFHPGSSSAEKRVPIKSSEAINHTLQQHQLPTRLQPLPSSQIQSSLRPNERPTFFMEDGNDKKSAFKAHVRPQNNLVIDLTRDSRPASGELSLSAHSQQGQAQQTSPMDDRLHYSRQDSTGRRNHVTLPNTGARINPSVDNMSSAIFHEFQTGLDKTNSLPNGFNTDRSRPGGFLTNQHRPPVRLERPIPVKDTIYMRDQIRPTMSTVTQHRQRYLDTSSASEQHINVASQSVMNKNYHKGSEELSPSYMPSSHMIAPTSAWGEDQHHSGADFNSAHASPAWRGHSPLAAASRHMEMYGDMDNIGNLMLAEDMDKQRNRADIHSAFQKHADMAYKQKQLDAGLGYRAPALNPGLHHTLQHPSLHPSAVPLHHQPPIMLQSFQTRPSLPDPPTSISDSYMRQQGQSQQHQQQKVRALPPLDGTQPSWKTYGSVDCTMTSSALQQRAPYAPNQPLNPSMSGIQDPMGYQKLQHHQQQQQQQQQILQHQQQYQFQQMQGRSAQKVIPTNQGSSPTGQRMPLPQSHPTQSLAIPQLMFSECSNTPNYPNISPNSPQAPGMILSQNQNIHHRPGEAEHLNIMRQRQFSKQHTVFDQRPRPQVPQSMAPPPSQTQSMLQSKPTTMSPMSGAARPAPAYTSIGQTISHSPSITNSLCRVCGNVAVYLCSSCRRVWYCNLHCQTKDWGVHATECKPAT